MRNSQHVKIGNIFLLGAALPHAKCNRFTYYAKNNMIWFRLNANYVISARSALHEEIAQVNVSCNSVFTCNRVLHPEIVPSY